MRICRTPNGFLEREIGAKNLCTSVPMLNPQAGPFLEFQQRAPASA
jgi:hypothetical protein